MKLIDLTQPWTTPMPTYPGDPQFQASSHATWADDGYRLTRYELHSHLGTHLDAPSHLLANGKTLADFPLTYFTGRAYVAPFPTTTVAEWKRAHAEAIQAADILLIHSGWSSQYGQDDYYQAFPVLPLELTAWLATQHLQIIGIDAPSFDAFSADRFINHELLLGADTLLLENVCHLEDLPPWCECDAFPFPFASDGSPVRAVAKIFEKPLKGAGTDGTNK